MAYSDYGGRAFKNGIRHEDRCDAVLSPDGIKSTPGQWPGWSLEEGRSGGSWHVILGDGPIFVTLYEQSSVDVYRLNERVDPSGILLPDQGDATYLNHENFRSARKPCLMEVDGHKISVWWCEEDNLYVYVRLEQPNGDIWSGWSGYGVGAGLEDCGYGFSSDARDATLSCLLASCGPLPSPPLASNPESLP